MATDAYSLLLTLDNINQTLYSNNTNITEVELFDMLDSTISLQRESWMYIENMWVFLACLPTLIYHVVFLVIKSYKSNCFQCSRKKERIALFPVMLALTAANYLVLQGWSDMLHELFSWSEYKANCCIKEHKSSGSTSDSTSGSTSSLGSSMTDLIWQDKCQYDSRINVVNMGLVYLGWFTALLGLLIASAIWIISCVVLFSQIIHSSRLKLHLIKLFGVLDGFLRCVGGFRGIIFIHYIFLLGHMLCLGTWGLFWFNTSLHDRNHQPAVAPQINACISILVAQEVEHTLAENHCSHLLLSKDAELVLGEIFIAYFVASGLMTMFYTSSIRISKTIVKKWQKEIRDEIREMEISDSLSGLGSNKEYNAGNFPEEIQKMLHHFSQPLDDDNDNNSDKDNSNDDNKDNSSNNNNEDDEQ